jgi:hypothetical protein
VDRSGDSLERGRGLRRNVLSPHDIPPASRIVLAGLLTGVTDGLFSSTLSVAFYGSTVTRLFQGVAGVLLGPAALKGGTSTAAIGILMHFGVAMAWSLIFAIVALRISWVANLLRSRWGIVKTAALYGPLVWMVMSLAIIPALTHRPPAITARWWTQFFGHMLFVGLPVVAITAGVKPKYRRD